jgi:hypothetical protein
MGRGVAVQAKVKYSGLAKALGKAILEKGNHVHYFEISGGLASFPVKHNWWEKADLDLIKRSADELVVLVDSLIGIEKVALPRPGCGNGRLAWKTVKPVLEYLDNRFYLITKP